MSKHTPTPWELSDPVLGIFEGHIFSEETRGSVAQIIKDHVSQSEAKANAQFIVKAANNHQNLMEALKSNMEELSFLIDSEYSAESIMEGIIEIHEVMRQALIKAEADNG